MTDDELVRKLDDAREALTDGDVTPREYLEWVSDIFDGHLGWALEGPPPAPRKVIRMYLMQR